MASRLLLPNILLSRRVLPLLPPPLSRLGDADCPYTDGGLDEKGRMLVVAMVNSGGCNGDVEEVDGDEDIDGDGDEAGDDVDEEKVDGVTVGRMQLPLREAVVASPARSSSLC